MHGIISWEINLIEKALKLFLLGKYTGNKIINFYSALDQGKGGRHLKTSKTGR